MLKGVVFRSEVIEGREIGALKNFRSHYNEKALPPISPQGGKKGVAPTSVAGMLGGELVAQVVEQQGGDVALAEVRNDNDDGLALVLVLLGLFQCCPDGGTGGDAGENALGLG